MITDFEIMGDKPDSGFMDIPEGTDEVVDW